MCQTKPYVSDNNTIEKVTYSGSRLTSNTVYKHAAADNI
jgi:hypothetical protein